MRPFNMVCLLSVNVLQTHQESFIIPYTVCEPNKNVWVVPEPEISTLYSAKHEGGNLAEASELSVISMNINETRQLACILQKKKTAGCFGMDLQREL